MKCYDLLLTYVVVFFDTNGLTSDSKRKRNIPETSSLNFSLSKAETVNIKRLVGADKSVGNSIADCKRTDFKQSFLYKRINFKFKYCLYPGFLFQGENFLFFGIIDISPRINRLFPEITYLLPWRNVLFQGKKELLPETNFPGLGTEHFCPGGFYSFLSPSLLTFNLITDNSYIN